MNDNSQKNNNTSLVLTISILLSFVCGMIGAYLITSNANLKGSYAVSSNEVGGTVIKNITTSELVETSIATSVDKVYDKTVVVISLSKGKQVSTGTGFVYKVENGKAYIMTNNHVIDEGNSAKIEFNHNNERVDVEIVGGDVYSDIAVLTMDAKYMPEAVEIGDSEKLKLGDTIFTVGAPMGIEYKGTVTKGIVSGLNRLVGVNLSSSSANDYYMQVIQMDAAVNPGNSGGPLCDVSGKVVGLISLKIVQDEVEGMGFSIPIEDALKYAAMIEKEGKIIRPYVGISMVDLSQESYLSQNKIVVPSNIKQGIVVLEVVIGSPAAKAGLKKGDIIIKLAGELVKTVSDFRYELYKHEVGKNVEFTFYRNGKLTTAMVTLGKSE